MIKRSASGSSLCGSNWQLEIPLHEDLRKIGSTLDYVDAAISRGESPRIETATLENLSRRADRLADYVNNHPAEMPKVDPKPLQESLATLKVSPVGLLEFDDALLKAKIAFLTSSSNTSAGLIGPGSRNSSTPRRGNSTPSEPPGSPRNRRS